MLVIILDIKLYNNFLMKSSRCRRWIENRHFSQNEMAVLHLIRKDESMH